MLFAGDGAGFEAAVEGWPDGVRETARGMAAGAWRNGMSDATASPAFKTSAPR